MPPPRIRAIPTTYNGKKFRSRLEAEWAEFLDLQGCPWKYEPRTFRFGGAGYKPDFLLYQCTWLEIKPVDPKPIEVLKACLLSAVTLQPVLLFSGHPGPRTAVRRYEGGYLVSWTSGYGATIGALEEARRQSAAPRT